MLTPSIAYGEGKTDVAAQSFVSSKLHGANSNEPNSNLLSKLGRNTARKVAYWQYVRAKVWSQAHINNDLFSLVPSSFANAVPFSKYQLPQRSASSRYRNVVLLQALYYFYAVSTDGEAKVKLKGP